LRVARDPLSSAALPIICLLLSARDVALLRGSVHRRITLARLGLLSSAWCNSSKALALGILGTWSAVSRRGLAPVEHPHLHLSLSTSPRDNRSWAVSGEARVSGPGTFASGRMHEERMRLEAAEMRVVFCTRGCLLRMNSSSQIHYHSSSTACFISPWSSGAHPMDILSISLGHTPHKIRGPISTPTVARHPSAVALLRVMPT
jgi:hypothetical protein